MSLAEGTFRVVLRTSLCLAPAAHSAPNFGLDSVYTIFAVSDTKFWQPGKAAKWGFPRPRQPDVGGASLLNAVFQAARCSCCRWTVSRTSSQRCAVGNCDQARAA